MYFSFVLSKLILSLLGNKAIQIMITIANLKENRIFVLETLKSRRFTEYCTESEFMSAMVSRIETYDFDNEETMEWNIQFMMSDIYRMQFSQSAVAKTKKNNNPNSLRNIYGQIQEREEAKGLKFNQITSRWEMA